MAYVSPKRLYRTANGEVVEEGDVNATTLLVGAGVPLSEQQVQQYGIRDFVHRTDEPAPTAPVQDISSRVAALEARLEALEAASAPSGQVETKAQAEGDNKAVSGADENKSAPRRAEVGEQTESRPRRS